MDRIQLGYVARAHGLRGELRVHLHAADSMTLYDVERAWFNGQERRILAVRPISRGLLVTVEGVEDRDAAEAMRGQVIEVERDDVELGEGEYLLADLPGCAVVDGAGQELGEIVEVIQAAQPILVIHGGGHERLLPAIPEFVREVDIPGRRIVVEPPEDLPAEPLTAGKPK